MNEEKKNNGKKKLIITMAVALTLLVGVTVSYGYIALVSSSKNQEISVGTGNIHLELDDADSGSIEANLNLGGSITKTLKITNKGTKPGKVQINWKNLINTYNSRSLSYTLETSSNKDTGYTKIEALRENVPVSTEAKEVPLSKEITVPVQSAPIYYRVTITFNDLEDVDQESDLSATLITQFSLSEPENLSKKVIAVLNGNVKTSDPSFSGPAPRYKYNFSLSESNMELEIATFDITENSYVAYGDGYELRGDGKIYLTNPQIGKYKDIYSSLVGKYTAFNYSDNAEEALEYYGNVGENFVDLIQSTTLDSVVIDEYVSKIAYTAGNLSSPTTKDMSSVQSNYFTYGSKLAVGTDGKFFLEDPKVCKWSECYSSLVGKYILRLTGASANTINNIGLTSAFYINNSTSLSTLNYSKVNRAQAIDNSYDGVYKTEDDYGDSYFYRGKVENNYFKFGGFYWRIIRVNGDGSIRLAYAGTKAYPNGTESDSDLITSNISISKRTAGYMIGIDEATDTISTSKQQADTNKYDTALKAAIDSWYESKLKTNAANGNIDMGAYLSDTLFCSDRSVAPSANLWENGDTALGYGNNQTMYGSYYRIKNFKPSLKCPLKNDRFTVSDTKVGNGALKYKIATITGDEMMMAGVTSDGSVSTGEDYMYLAWYGIHTMSPGKIFSGTSNSDVHLSNIQRNGRSMILSNLDVNMRTVPVINIASEYGQKVIGSGTMTDPFMIPGVN